ncbi:MAG TPA: hypothetical protein DCR78_19785 [Pseudomonas sp.]|jgi:hypothetical protein|uniref:hypothetical protein n=1 Tax=Stutzerimonas TaxID=2901164 RepID=UPI000C999C70|nr:MULTISPECIES: hypothetical protein [Stutzerimonas]MBU2283017.1 hypothetical protein [Gammaproteobacteria bacterium]HAQ88660.1 hypothetical protein [Pseudomonas sp.]MBK3847532.1 hypothetical protein [Stutzerimonas xanthomarina]MBU2373676.1 hypothetical protein [Gammaproteobacteria bacterium]MCQ4280878.1 hypothetical protein [Stutzerimonas stutzeri]|tara:strand:- start:90 stop:428 length:339 start_codon:yes stop_codon:yes gene_type:complete
MMLAGLSLTGCQNASELLVADEYPPAYADGFRAGCGSGRQAAGALAQFRKDVPRYMDQPLYAEGWNDGYRQCQAMQIDTGGLTAWRSNALERDRDRAWRHHVDQAKAEAFHR